MRSGETGQDVGVGVRVAIAPRGGETGGQAVRYASFDRDDDLARRWTEGSSGVT